MNMWFLPTILKAMSTRQVKRITKFIIAILPRCHSLIDSGERLHAYFKWCLLCLFSKEYLGLTLVLSDIERFIVMQKSRCNWELHCLKTVASIFMQRWQNLSSPPPHNTVTMWITSHAQFFLLVSVIFTPVHRSLSMGASQSIRHL